MGMQQFCLKSTILTFCEQDLLTLLQICVILLFASSSGRSNRISASYNYISFCEFLLLKERQGRTLISEVPTSRSK